MRRKAFGKQWRRGDGLGEREREESVVVALCEELEKEFLSIRSGSL
jgi:hypothetical protein